MAKKRYTFTLDPEVVEAFRKKVGKLSPAVEELMRACTEQTAAPQEETLEEKVYRLRPCKHCGTNGDHYCPADVPKGYGAGDEYCEGCDLPLGSCECES